MRRGGPLIRRLISTTAVAALVASASFVLLSTAGQASAAPPAPAPLAFQKSTTTNNFSKIGDKIAYTFKATNNTDSTITGVGVTDTQNSPAGALDAPPVCVTVTNPSNACTAANTTTLLAGATASGAGVAGGPLGILGTAVTSSGVTVINGDLGTTATPYATGFPPGVVNGNTHLNDAVAAQAKQDQLTAYQNAQSLTPTGTLPGSVLSATFTPGVYHSAGAFSVVGTMTLDAGNDPTAKFVFQVNGAFGTAEGSQILLINGANANNVTFAANGAIGSGAGSAVVGNLLSNGALTLGDSSTLQGRGLASGAVTLTNNTISAPAETRGPGQTGTFTATYTVTQQDLDNGFVSDSAIAAGTTAANAAISSAASAVSVPAVQNPILTISKTSATSTATRVGQVIPYTFVATNTGNVTISAVSINDVQATPGKSLDAAPACQVLASPAAPCSGTSTSLAPNQSGNFTGTYTVSQPDFDAGNVRDSATAVGKAPNHSDVTSNTSSVTIPADAPAPPPTSTVTVTVTPPPSTVTQTVPTTVTAAPTTVTQTVTQPPTTVTAAPVTVTDPPTTTVTAAPVTVTDPPTTVTAAPVTVTDPPTTVTGAPVTVTGPPTTITVKAPADPPITVTRNVYSTLASASYLPPPYQSVPVIQTNTVYVTVTKIVTVPGPGIPYPVTVTITETKTVTITVTGTGPDHPLPVTVTDIVTKTVTSKVAGATSDPPVTVVQSTSTTATGTAPTSAQPVTTTVITAASTVTSYPLAFNNSGRSSVAIPTGAGAGNISWIWLAIGSIFIFAAVITYALRRRFIRPLGNSGR